MNLCSVISSLCFAPWVMVPTLQLQDAPACNLIFSLKNNANGFGINAMLFFQDSLEERSLRVVVFHRNDGLHDNRASVKILVHKMHGATGEFHAVFKRLPLRFEPRKRRDRKSTRLNSSHVSLSR